MQGHCLVIIDKIFALLVSDTIAVVGAIESGVERAVTRGVLAEFVLPQLVVWLVLGNPISAWIHGME